MKTDDKAQQLAAKTNALLAWHGIVIGQTVSGTLKTGCRWCPHSQAFQTWLPAVTLRGEASIPLVHKVVETFERGGWKVSYHSCESIGEPDFIQIDAHLE